ncbi:DUF2631 domain-containing protein [Prauserella sp. PE36]|uniref:DUF2631 domain-containing protein n=1 Tax=Prauserella endophytica TaxID=1592324 RepID=A0ABY2S6U4_9PSEU|nr:MULTISPECIES: DUF2631 domain-containing protein [Prauserella]PXY26242.1 hypothetical protein BAY59_21815 [Prauserella coralliicola]RBM20143.1 DUF2631 domain-containing protein [Prauserella sp. PE36]TKG71391.1 DUF2631 domain-containing protein [Prauserella endophytica]
MAGKAIEKRSGTEVDPRDEPSAEWGWHGGFPKATRFAGWFTVFALLVMLIGNHENNTENVWLVGLALSVAFGLVLDMRRRRTSWRR